MTALFRSELRRRTLELGERSAEWQACAASFPHFTCEHLQIYDADAKGWIPFALWAEQVGVADLILANPKTIILKARQLGLTWLVLAIALWLMIFHPAQTVLLFSLRETEAKYLLGPERFGGMLSRLPAYLRPRVTTSNTVHVQFANESSIRAFPTSAGDSYTATLAIVDEADLVPDLDRLLRSVEPTVEAGGKLVLLSRANKDLPISHFKAIYGAAKKGENEYVRAFLPWHVRPGRDAEWYERKRRDSMANTHSLDNLHEQFPATDTEALAPDSRDKRIPADWLLACYEERTPLDLATLPGAPPVPELRVYSPPVEGRRYRFGADPAEGLATGDDSSLIVLDFDTGEEVANCTGKLEPKRVFPDAIVQIAAWYNAAEGLIERNNHGHAVIAGCEGKGMTLLPGRDERAGWQESLLAKTIMYDTAVDQIKNGEVRLHSFSCQQQLASIERGSLSAPKNLHDDEAVAFVLAQTARTIEGKKLPSHMGGGS